MPFVNAPGRITHGVGGVGAFLDNVQFDTGGGPVWMDKKHAIDKRIIYQHGGADGWFLQFYDPDTGQFSRLKPEDTPFWNQGVNFLSADAGVWAGWANGVGLFTSTGLHVPAAGSAIVGPDGSLAYRPQYHSNGPTILRNPDGTEDVLEAFEPAYDVMPLGQGRAIWRVGHQIRVRGIPQPLQIGNIWAPKAVHLNGEWWVSYFSDIVGIAFHPFNSTVGYPVVPTGDAWYDHHILDGPPGPQILRFGWSVRQGEVAGDIFHKDINTTVDPRVELKSPLVITPINRSHWLGCFTGQPGVSGGWDTNDDPVEFRNRYALPGNGYLDVPTSKFYSKNDEPVGSFIHSQPGWTVEMMEEAARNAEHTPICYWDARTWPRLPNLPEHSWLCVQGYCGKNESLSAFENSLRAILTDIRNTKPTQLVAIVAQAFWQTPVNSLTDDLSGLVPVFSRLAASFPNVIATIPFNGNGRFNGMQQHPEIRPLWDQVAATIPSAPPIEPPETPMIKPVVTVHRWTLNELVDGREFVFEDTNNPDLGYKARVHIREGSMYAEFTNKMGEASTGMRRPVKKCDTPNPPDPPDPPNPPVGTKYYVKTDHGTYLYVDQADDNAVKHSATLKTAFTVADVPNEPDVKSIKAETGYVAAEPPEGNLQADRGTVGDWEKWRIENHPTIADRKTLFALSTQRFASAQPDGSIWANRSNRDTWEAFALESATGGPVGDKRMPQGTTHIVNATALGDDLGPRAQLGASMFSALWLYRNERDRLEQNLQWLADAHFDHVRILGEVGPQWWENRVIDPNWPDYDDVLRGFATLAHDKYGIRTEMTFFGGGQNVPDNISARRAFVDKVLNVLLSIEHTVAYYEVGNESWQTGFPHPDGTAQLRELARHILSRSQRPCAVTSPAGPEAYGVPDTGGDSWAFGYAATYKDVGATLGTVHLDRNNAEEGWRPVRQPWEYQFMQGNPAFMPRFGSNDEPIGPGASVNSMIDPMKLIMSALVTWVSSMGIYVFHSNAGVWAGGTAGGTQQPQANYWDIPFQDQVQAGFRAMRRYTPDDLALWSPKNTHWDGHPFKGSLDGQNWTADGSGRGVSRAYATTKGDEFFCVPCGVKQFFDMKAARNMHVQVLNPLTGDIVEEKDLNAGEILHLTDGLGAYVVKGHYR